MSREPTVGDLMADPDVWEPLVARIVRKRDERGLAWEAEDRERAAAHGYELDDYYCLRCHRSHFLWSAIGERHAVPQPTPLSPEASR